MTTTPAYHFDATILREYDIRGIVGKTLNESDARAVGHAYGTIIVRNGGKTVATGYDGRHSSPALEQALTDGLKAAGLHVVRVGLGPTPMLYFATRHLPTDAGIMITGSHNPPDYNGIKMVLGKMAVYGAAIQEIGTVAAAGDFVHGTGSEETVDLQDIYTERLLKDYLPGKNLTVVWDAGNGSSGEILRRMTAKLPGTHHLLFDNIDGNFPNHHPDPTIPKNLVDLQKAVAEKKADVGIAFDGDGDRIGAVDANGGIVWGDQLLGIYAAEVLKSHPGAPIVADVKTSQALFDEIKNQNGTPVMWKTGHSLIKAKMAEINSPLGGEMSGHIFFADKWYGFDDALYCGIRLVSLLARSEKTLETLRDDLPKLISTPEVRFQVDESRKFASVDEIKARVKASGATVIDIDGVRVITEDGWWLLRASNTQDVLVARAESYTNEGLDRLKGALIAELKASGINAPAF